MDIDDYRPYEQYKPDNIKIFLKPYCKHCTMCELHDTKVREPGGIISHEITCNHHDSTYCALAYHTMLIEQC